MTIIVILSYHNDNSANNFDLWALRDPAAGDAAAAKGYVIDCEGWRRRCWRRRGPRTWRRSGGPTRSGPRPTPPAGDARDRMIIFIIIIIIIDYYYHIVFARRPLVMRGPGLYGCY